MGGGTMGRGGSERGIPNGMAGEVAERAGGEARREMREWRRMDDDRLAHSAEEHLAALRCARTELFDTP